MNCRLVVLSCVKQLSHSGRVSPSIANLPQDSREESKNIIVEGQLEAKTPLLATMDASDTASRSMATSVTTHRASWLQVSDIRKKVKHTIENFLFESKELFSIHEENALHSLKDSRAMLCAWASTH